MDCGLPAVRQLARIQMLSPKALLRHGRLTLLQSDILQVKGIPEDVAAAWFVFFGEEQQIRVDEECYLSKVGKERLLRLERVKMPQLPRRLLYAHKKHRTFPLNIYKT